MPKSKSLPQTLATALQSTTRRLRLQQTVRLTFWLLGLGLLVTLLLTLLGRMYPLAFPLTLLRLGLGFTGLGLLITWGYIWLQPQSPLVVARLLERRLNLDERLSTAVELANNREPHSSLNIIQAQRADALRHLENFDPALIWPIRLPWPWLMLNALLVAAITYNYIMPNPQIEALQQQQQTKEVISQQLTRFEEIQAELLADEPLMATPQGEVLEQTLNELIDKLQENKLSLEEALAAVSEAEQQLAIIEVATSPQEGLLNELVRTFSQFDSTTKLAETLEQGDLTQAAEALASAGNKLGLTPQAGQDLVEALRQAAQAAQQAGDSALAKALNQAAEALQQSLAQGGEGGQQALKQAGQALAKAGQALAGQQAVKNALSNIQQAREQLAQCAAGPGQSPPAGSLTQGQGTTGGAGRGEPGPGADGLFTIETAPAEMSTDNGPNQGLVGKYESLYAPSHLGGEGGPLVNPPAQGVQGGIPVGEAPVDPNREAGKALVPYNQVYGQYSEAAGQALHDSYIPLGLKGYIRQYFGTLEPE